MGKVRWDLRVAEPIAEWADSYADHVGITRTTLVEDALMVVRAAVEAKAREPSALERYQAPLPPQPDRPPEPELSKEPPKSPAAVAAGGGCWQHIRFGRVRSHGRWVCGHPDCTRQVT